MSNKLEVAEWLRKSNNLVLHDYDEDGRIIDHSSSGADQVPEVPLSLSNPATSQFAPNSPPGSPSRTRAFSLIDAASLSSSRSRNIRGVKSGGPVKYRALEMEVELDRERSEVDHTKSLLAMSITRDKTRATGGVKFGTKAVMSSSVGPTPPRARKRAISGAVIGASSGKEHFMKPRKMISRGDMVKRRLQMPQDTRVRSNKFNPLVKEIEERLENLKFDREMRSELQANIVRSISERKRRVLEQQSEDSVQVNIERVRQGYYSSDISKMQIEESAGRMKERQELSARRRKEVEEKENEKADRYTKEMLRRNRMANALDRQLMLKAEEIRHKLLRSRHWIGLLQLTKVVKIWSSKVLAKSSQLKAHKIEYDAAVMIQNLYKNWKMTTLGQMFREAVMKMKNFVNSVIGRWRARRLRRGADLLSLFLHENNAAPIKFMVLQFLGKVKHCQRIWRSFNDCTDARVALLKLYWAKAEDANFQQRKKELIAEANERRKLEEELNNDRAVIMEQEEKKRQKERKKKFGNKRKGGGKGGG
ncbi:hypothetical protein TrRE_jg9481, partial [Triparma retinervis]